MTWLEFAKVFVNDVLWFAGLGFLMALPAVWWVERKRPALRVGDWVHYFDKKVRIVDITQDKDGVKTVLMRKEDFLA